MAKESPGVATQYKSDEQNVDERDMPYDKTYFHLGSSTYMYLSIHYVDEYPIVELLNKESRKLKMTVTDYEG
jgi:hypothetical protein